MTDRFTPVEGVPVPVPPPPQPFWTSKTFVLQCIAGIVLGAYIVIEKKWDQIPLLLAMLGLGGAAVSRWTADQPLSFKGGEKLSRTELAVNASLFGK